MEELTSDHEKADTLVLLHAQHASDAFSSVTIKTPDTDILLLCLAHHDKCSADMYVATGTGSASHLLSVRTLLQKCGSALSSALLSLYAFTGCDSVSCFKGKGKVKPFQLMQGKEEFIYTFRLLGSRSDMTEELLQWLEQFVCCLYGHKTVSTVNEARANLFKSSGRFDSSLPPCSDSLKLHVFRANFQAAIWRQCFQARIRASSPTDHGWIIQDEELIVQWSSLPPAPSGLSQLVKCACKNNCNSRHCSCVSQNLPCTDLCQCVNCLNENTNQEDSQQCDVEDSDLSSEDEED